MQQTQKPFEKVVVSFDPFISFVKTAFVLFAKFETSDIREQEISNAVNNLTTEGTRSGVGL